MIIFKESYHHSSLFLSPHCFGLYYQLFFPRRNRTKSIEWRIYAKLIRSLGKVIRKLKTNHNTFSFFALNHENFLFFFWCIIENIQFILTLGFRVFFSTLFSPFFLSLLEGFCLQQLVLLSFFVNFLSIIHLHSYNLLSILFYLILFILSMRISIGLLDSSSTNTNSGFIILGWLKSGIGGGFLFFLFSFCQSFVIF